VLAKGSPKKPQFAISDVLVWDDISQQVHLNQKPLGVISRLISTYSVEKASILDPFCGSGTTLVAARNLARRAVGIEIDERYCELAARRLPRHVFHYREPIGLPEQLLLS
jgi:site-specific DNA-methyltransferase (adenine-specific)